MFQKLLIVFCTIFVLSACGGGSNDLGPKQAPPPVDNGGDGGGGEPEPEPEPAEPRIFSFIAFSEEADTYDWSSRCVDACSATATLSWNANEQVLAVDPQWASDTDQLDIVGSVGEVSDMAGSAARVWVFVTEEYANDGKMSMHLLLGNAQGRKAVSLGYQPKAGWNRLEMWEMAAGTGETVMVGDVEAIDYGTFAWHDEGFTLRNINEIGVRFVANGKAPEVDGQVWLDNVTLTPASGTGPLIVDMDDAAWTVMDATPAVTVQRDDTGVYFEPTAGDQKLVYLLEGPVDLVGRSFDMTFTVDQAFKDSGADVQPIIQLNFGSYTGEFGCYVGNGSLTPGVPQTINCATDNDAFVAEEGQNIRVGLQVKNQPAGRLTINSMQINIVSSSDTGPFAIIPSQASVDSGAWSNDNWQGLASAPDLSYDSESGALSIAPNWQATDSNERTVMYVAAENELPDLEGATVGVELYLSDYYITENPGMAIQIYIQQNSGSYSGNFGSNIALSAAEDLGNGWYRFERVMEGVPTEPTALRMGIKLQGADLATREASADPILLRRFTVE
ncbi:MULTISPECIES: family 15 carbohydrate-binding domain-containing protein [unclassified Cellvibrio]|uniref:family 15 carbohydrate-binding domain-containing protein n=1 Tax=unclassified Cellvibrio TaxID=2624793 RepID=UPI0002FDD0A9|nr:MULTISPECIES: family 15 carbohydrate-binding domain-containing protein [unclassified Cellvibrio]UUA72257.1 family 15 carbohydrate-binding domain-containing protein [Cellvibrio sp. QJXJ]